MKRKPTGFIAICQCGRTVGALDIVLTDKKDAGKLLGTWVAEIKPCVCAKLARKEAHDVAL